MKPRSLRTRLFASYVAVALVGAVTLIVAVRLLVPAFFDEQMRRSRGAGGGQHDAVVAALNISIVVAVAASVVAASIVAVFVARRLLRPLDELRAATRRIAAGRYDEPVTAPGEPELAALAADVNHLARSLAATEQRRAALIGDIAHEMRTPLTAITGYLDGFNDGLFTQDEMTGTVTDELDRLHRLARDLATVSCAEEDELDLTPADADISTLVASACDRLRPQFLAKGVELRARTAEGITGCVDAQRLVQAVTNLLGNALAYTPSAGTVTVAVTADTDRARITVTDTGRGIAPQDLDLIFERFYRGDPADHSGGTGIGLTIARAIARAHGGDLHANSPGPGLGATFELTLPRTSCATGSA